MRTAVAALCSHDAKGVSQTLPTLDTFKSDDANDDLMYGILALPRRARMGVPALTDPDDRVAKSSHEIARHLPVNRPPLSSALACVLC